MEKKKTWRINAAYTVFQEKDSTVSKSSLYLHSYPPCIIWNKRSGSSIGLPVYYPPSPMTSKPCSMLLEQQSQMGSIWTQL